MKGISFSKEQNRYYGDIFLDDVSLLHKILSLLLLGFCKLAIFSFLAIQTPSSGSSFLDVCLTAVSPVSEELSSTKKPSSRVSSISYRQNWNKLQLVFSLMNCSKYTVKLFPDWIFLSNQMFQKCSLFLYFFNNLHLYYFLVHAYMFCQNKKSKMVLPLCRWMNICALVIIASKSGTGQHFTFLGNSRFLYHWALL